MENGCKDFIYLIKSKLVQDSSDKVFNDIDGSHLLSIVENFKKPTEMRMVGWSVNMRSFIVDNYSWAHEEKGTPDK